MALELRKIGKLFTEKNNPDSRFRLSVNLETRDGEFVSIVGPSGSGKTTLLKIILGIIPPDEGQILLNGTDITGMSIEKRNIGCIFQDFALFENMDVSRNITFPMRVKHTDRRQMMKQLDYLLGICNLENCRTKSIQSLSGGEKQRVAIARALAQQPSLLLLDEPMSSLDSGLKTGLLQEISRIHRTTGITMLYVTHDSGEALSLSDRIALLDNGSLIQFDKPSVIYNRPASPACASLVGNGSFFPETAVTPSAASESKCFFRPENATILPEDNGTGTETRSDILFSNLRIVSQAYNGERYLVTFLWKDRILLKAYSENKLIQDRMYSLSVASADIISFT